jgi:hypothetical protein
MKAFTAALTSVLFQVRLSRFRWRVNGLVLKSSRMSLDVIVDNVCRHEIARGRRDLNGMEPLYKIQLYPDVVHYVYNHV